MVKTRPVVVVSPRLRRRGDLVGVVPFSTTAPAHIENYHLELDMDPVLPKPFAAPRVWVKCDMYSVVSLERLDRFRTTRDTISGKRRWMTSAVSDAELVAIRKAVLKV